VGVPGCVSAVSRQCLAYISAVSRVYSLCFLAATSAASLSASALAGVSAAGLSASAVLAAAPSTCSVWRR